MTTEDLKKLNEELKWITVREQNENSFFEKIKAKGILGFLVPTGCILTSGVLFRGFYYLIKKDSRQQQKMMRYRVGAQGATIAIAMIGLLLVPLTTKSE